MKTFICCLLTLISFVSAANAQSEPGKTMVITTETLRDKIAGGWAGKMIGVTYGAPSEFRYLQKINEDSIKWNPADIKGSIQQDDLYVQLTFLMAMDKAGMDAPAATFQEMLAKAAYPLWCANMQARKNYFDGIYPPASGSPENNFRADDIDFQIESDFIGFMNPGMLQNVVDLSDKLGHIMNYGDGVYGGMFVAAMYSAACFDNDMHSVIQKALSVIPPESDYSKIIRDVVKLNKHYPADWKAAWKELDSKWGDADISGAGSAFNIDAKLNGAFIVMGLLYGEGDAYKTLEIATRCGQDADCNASSAMAVLGVLKGFSNLPPEMQKGVNAVGDSVFLNTSYSFNSMVESTYKYAIELIKRNRGLLNGNRIILPAQLLIPAKYEVSFPDAVYDKTVSVFSGRDWDFRGNWQVFKQEAGDGKAATAQAMFAGKAGSKAELTFEGTGISLMGNWVKDGGRADVYLDGKMQRGIDTYYNYSRQEHLNVSLWHAFQLPAGKHTIKIVVKGDKNPASSGSNVYITQALIYKTAAKKSDSYKFSFE